METEEEYWEWQLEEHYQNAECDFLGTIFTCDQEGAGRIDWQMVVLIAPPSPDIAHKLKDAHARGNDRHTDQHNQRHSQGVAQRVEEKVGPTD